MNNALVTVVLPIYNVEAYLHRSVNSVLCQTYPNLEILLIDDGSPDQCPALCDALAASDPRIRVIHKENAGLGMARNTGIDAATGQYICFLDSDDYIAPDTIEKSLQQMLQTQADIVLYGYHNVDSTGAVVRTNIPNPVKTLYEGKEVQSTLLPDLIYDDPKASAQNNLWFSMCGGLFSVELLRKSNWHSVSERQIIAEDVFSLTRLYRYVNKVSILQEAFYYYCENGSSLTRTYKPDRFKGIKHFYQQSLIQAEELGLNDAVKTRLAMVTLSYIIAALKQEAAAPRSAKENREGVRSIVCDPVMQQLLQVGKNPLDSKGRQLLLLCAQAKASYLCYILLRAKG